MAEKYKKHAILIGCVGKPNAGKSSFLNACTDAKAKVGNYPFTTIDPNQGIAHYSVQCPCKNYGVSDKCRPRYGKCVDGMRYLPIKVLDVAGLIPGASEGLGLGNKFLDDLRSASVLLHVVDVSGNTNEKGEVTKGYDPTRDVQWLQLEINSWIFNNLWKKWKNLIRKHNLTRATALETLHIPLSGYGTRQSVVQRVLDTMGIKEPAHLDQWEKEDVQNFVSEFIKERFPTILVLNKVDQEMADRNICKICEGNSNEHVVPCSALAECFLKKLRQAGLVHYPPGSEDVFTFEDEQEGEQYGEVPLKPLDDKAKTRLEKIKDLVLYRYGSTGVQEAINAAVEHKKMIPVYWVRNLNTFQCDRSDGVFRDCTLVKEGTSVREVFNMIFPEQHNTLAFIEDISQRRVGELEQVTAENNIFKFSIAVVSQEKSGAQ
mmetsp:Transcript_790/g.994  ORF Transcript_790/g.994 Transcript_790/m.994 type:complete len:432 (-) Transcript_790:37-1332(-)